MKRTRLLKIVLKQVRVDVSLIDSFISYYLEADSEKKFRYFRYQKN